jgi:hypothetical protein
MSYAQKQEASRFFNLGIKLGVPYLFAEVNDNPSGSYPASHVWGSLLASNLALSAQLEKTNGFRLWLRVRLPSASSRICQLQKASGFTVIF